MGRDISERADWERRRYLRFTELVKETFDTTEASEGHTKTGRSKVWLQVVRQAIAQLEREIPTPLEYQYERIPLSKKEAAS
jgi:hypothetical protein